MEIDILRNLYVNKKATGLRFNGLARSKQFAPKDERNCTTTEDEPVAIDRLRQLYSSCKQRGGRIELPFAILSEQLFQTRCWLGMERMSSVELARRQQSFIRMSAVAWVVLLGAMMWAMSMSSGASCKSPIAQPVANPVKAPKAQIAQSVVSTAPTKRRYQAPFILPEPNTTYRVSPKPGETVRKPEPVLKAPEPEKQQSPKANESEVAAMHY